MEFDLKETYCGWNKLPSHKFTLEKHEMNNSRAFDDKDFWKKIVGWRQDDLPTRPCSVNEVAVMFEDDDFDEYWYHVPIQLFNKWYELHKQENGIITQIKKGTRLNVNHSRSGKWVGIATDDFDLENDEWYHIALAQKKIVRGLSTDYYWVEGEDMPCRRGLCTVEIIKEATV